MPTFYDPSERGKIKPKDLGKSYCYFYDIESQRDYIIRENKYWFVQYNKFPYGGVNKPEKSLIAIPKRHIEHVSDLTDEERKAMGEVEKVIKEFFKDKEYFSLTRHIGSGKSLAHIHHHYIQGHAKREIIASTIQ